MYDEIIHENLVDSFTNLFIQKNSEEVELLDLGIITTKCYTPKISMLIHCMDNMDLFNDEQKGNIQTMINKYKYV